MDSKAFIQDQVAEIQRAVGNGRAINALSGGVDSSVVTALGHRALGDRLRTIFVDNALMRDGEPQSVLDMFQDMGIPVEIVDARDEFLPREAVELRGHLGVAAGGGAVRLDHGRVQVAPVGRAIRGLGAPGGPAEDRAQQQGDSHGPSRP